MTGPRMGRGVALVAAVAVAGSVAFAVVRTSRPEWSLAVPSLLIAAYSAMRLALWALTAGSPPRSESPVDDRGRAAAVLAEARTEIAVIAEDEPSVHVRTAVLAAIAAASQPRVMLVGADRRLSELARSLGVRHVPADEGWDAGVAAALADARGELLLVSTASSAVVPGAIGRVVDHFDSGCVWVQTTISAPADRDVLDQFDHAVVQPGLDRHDSVVWTGPGSIVAVDALRTVHAGADAATVTRRLHARGWHGRFSPQTLVVPLRDRMPAPVRTSALPTLWTRRVRFRQRLAAVRSAIDDLSPLMAVVAVTTVAAAAAAGRAPVPLDERVLPVVGAWLLASVARLLMSRGIVRPGALALSDLDAVARPRRRRGGPRRRHPGGLRALAVVLDVALVTAAVRMVLDRAAGDSTRLTDVVVLSAGLAALVAVLGATRVLVRNRAMRVGRRVPVQVTARVGDHQGRVVDLSADGFRLELAAPATLLAVLVVRFQVDRRRPVDVRAQVVRVERSSRGWLIGARLLGGESSGAHDDYLGLWLANAAAAANVEPAVSRVPHLGRLPVRSVGAPAVRWATAFVALLIGTAALPVHVTRASDTTAAVTAEGAATVDTTAAPATSTSVPAAPATVTATAPSMAEPADDGGEIDAAGATDVTDPIDGADLPDGSDDLPDGSDGSSVTSTSLLAGGVGGVKPTLQITTTAASADPSSTTEGQLRFGVLFNWQIEVRNISAVGDEGERVAYGVDVIDTLPANWNYSATVSTVPPRCDAAPVITPVDGAETIAWTDMCDLEPGQSVTITFAAMPQLSASQDPGLLDADGDRVAHTNRVELSAEDDEGTSLGTATASATTFPRLVDLHVRLTDSSADGDGATGGAGFVLGTIGRYRIDVRNTGPDAATGPIVVTLALPAGLAMWTAAGDGWTCTPGVSVVCTTPGPVPVGGAVAPVHVEVAIGPEALNAADSDEDAETGTVTATVSVTGADLDTDSSDDADDEPTPVRRIADLDLTGVPSPITFEPGVRVETVLTVTNLGPSPADGLIEIDDQIAAGLRIVSAIGSGWSCGASRVGRAYTAEPDTNGTLSCRRTVDELAPGSVLPPLTVRLQPDPFLGVTGVAEPTVPGTVRSPADDNAANDVVDRSLAPPASALLTISAFDDLTDHLVGDSVTTEVAVTNQGPAAEVGPVTVHSEAADGFVPTEVEGAGWACTVEGAAWTCTFDGVDAGGVAVVPGTHLPPLSVTGTLTGGSASVATDESTFDQRVVVNGVTDSVPREATIGRTVRPQSELAVDAVSSTDPWVSGEEAEMRLTVRSIGPSPELGPVAITHLLPPGVELIGAAGDGWSCEVQTGRTSGPSGTLACQHDRSGLDDDEPLLAVGETLAPVEFTVLVANDAMDVATIAGDGRGSLAWGSAVRGTTDTTVRRSTGTIALRRAVTVDATLAVVDGDLRVGDVGVVRATVTNDGRSDTVDPTLLRVALPEGIGFRNANGDGWSCAGDGPVVSCTHDAPIAAAGSASVELTVDVAAEARSAGNTVRFSASLGPNGTPVTTDVLVLTGSDDIVDPTTPVASAPAPGAVAGDGPSVARWSLNEAGMPASILGFVITALSLAMALVLVTGRRRLPVC